MKLSSFSKKMIISLIVAGILITIGGAVYFLFATRVNGEFYYAQTLRRTAGFGLGVAVGIIANIMKLYMLERSVHKIRNSENAGHAKTTAQLQHLLRFGLTAACLAFAALVPFVDFFGAIFGVLSAPVILYVISIVKRRELTEGGDED